MCCLKEDTFKQKDQVWKLIHIENIPGKRVLQNKFNIWKNSRKKYMRQRWVFYAGKIKKKKLR